MDICKFNVYTINWNESRILPAFLHYYRYANRIIVYDNESTDNSIELIKAARREVITFNTNGKFDDETNIILKNTIWKDAREDDVDYVIVQDLDEFLYFPDYPDDIPSALFEYKKNKITAAICKGYNMVCSDKKWNDAISKVKEGKNICFSIKYGFRSDDYDKPILFNPREIIETNYTIGAHNWSPTGIIKYPSKCPYLLHYKYIGYRYSLQNALDKASRLSELNIKNGWGIHYTWNQKQRIKEIFKKDRQKII